MKVLLLAALVVSISAAWWDPSSEENEGFVSHTEYQSGKEYVYKFESQVLSSLPSFTNSHGGIKIVSEKVKLDFTSSTKAVLQMTDCQILSLNQEISDPADLPPTRQLPTNRFTALPSNEASLIKSKLELPIKFSYKDGKVTSIEITDQETNWSIDMKRAILSMLQIRIQADRSSSNPELSYNELSEDNSTVFRFLEPALDGTCYSGITVQRPFNPTEENQYKIMKTRDPVDCVNQHSLFKVTWPRLNVTSCDCQPNLNKKECKCRPTAEEYSAANPAYFDAKTLSEYEVVSSDMEKLLIKSCVQSATYRYEFPNYPEQYLATFSNQTFQLKEQKDEQTISVRSYSFKSVSEPWKQQILKPEEEKLMMTAEQIFSQARSLIDELITISSETSRFEDHWLVFSQLIENFRLYNKQQLQQLFQEFDINDNYRSWKVMVDALAHCNTTVCDHFLLKKIASGGDKFPSTEATPIFMLWASNKVPTTLVLNKFKDYVVPGLEGKTEKKMAYQHSLMCFGSLIRRYIHSEDMKMKLCALQADKQRHQKNIDDCRTYEQFLENKLKSGDSDEEKIAALKALTNLGSIESLTKLQKMMAKTESTSVRVHAIYAVSNLRFENRLKVLQTITPILKDVTEDSVVRRAAFIIYLASNPSTTQLHRIIEQEPDLDLKTSFVQSLQNELKAAVHSSSGLGAQKAKSVLSKVRAFQMSANTGDYEMRFGLRPDTDGDILNWRWFTNQTSSIPRAANFQHRNIIRGQPHLNFEIGFTSEGFETLFAKLTEKYSSSRSHPDTSILDSLVTKSRDWKKNQVKPRLTLYLRSEGQDVGYFHLDTETINKHMISAISQGQVEIPVQWFQTYVTKPEQNKKLQQYGMWQVSERANVGVIDINGTLIIRRPAEGEFMPNISFGSEKMFRFEKKNMIAQYVRSGFAMTGVTSVSVSRHSIGEQKWNVSYSFHQQNMTFNVSHSSKPILISEIEAYTNTFVIPMRLPKIIKKKSEACRDIVTHDPERVSFNTQLESFKSVELDAQVEGDVCVPELYTFVRDRLHLLPSILSIKKQHLKFTLRPDTSAQRNYTFTQSLRTVKNEIASQVTDLPNAEKDQSVEKVQKSWTSMFGNMFSSTSSSESSSSSEEISYITSDNYDPLKELRIGSIRQLWQGRIESRYHEKTLSMIANLTTQYEHDQPTVHTILSYVRPPVPGKETDRYVFTVVSSRDFNPSINQFVGTHTLAWGEKSDPTKSVVNVTEEYTAMYKDDVCYEQTAYGCKDRYGVFYPLWYNHTTVVEERNTNVASQILRQFTPLYMNSAEQVLIHSVNMTQWRKNSFNMTRVYRPYEYEVDVAYALDGQNWNMSRVFLPVETAVEEIFNVRPMYPLGVNRPVTQFLSGHQQVDPFFSRDSCVFENSRVLSMDYKQIANPKTDCEMVLLGDCGMKNKQIMVSLKSAITGRTVDKKTMKVILGASKIEIELNHGSSYSSPTVIIRVNGRQMNLNSNDQLLVKQEKKTVAIIECSDNKQCDIKSSPHGLYVRINEQRVKVEMDNGRANYMCGVCSAHPELRTSQASYNQSVQIFKNNRNQNGKCNIEENSDEARRYMEQYTCKSERQHKMMSAIFDGQLRTCVTTDKLPMCSRHCDTKMLRFEHLPVRCVDREEARRLDMFPTMEGNEMYLEEDRLISKMRGSERRNLRVPVSQECQ